MELSGCHFEYAGIPSRTYDLIFANIDSERYTAIMGEVSTESIFNRHSKKRHYVGTSYEDSPISFDAEIVADAPLSPFVIRKIEQWLFGQSSYRPLYVDVDDSGYDGVEVVDGIMLRQYLNCRFLNPRKIEGNGGVMGWYFTVECDAPMAWQDPSVKTITSPPANFSIIVNTDLNDYIYPKVTIKTSSGDAADIQIVNHSDSDSRLTTFISMSSEATLIMDGDRNLLSGSSDNYYEKFKNKNFVRLKNGENKFSISGNIESITFEWQNMRWM